jgi:hypothetical protein
MAVGVVVRTPSRDVRSASGETGAYSVTVVLMADVTSSTEL